jgi:hypothetical protein
LTAFSTAKKAPSPSISQASKKYLPQNRIFLHPKPIRQILWCLFGGKSTSAKFEVGREQSLSLYRWWKIILTI